MRFFFIPFAGGSRYSYSKFVELGQKSRLDIIPLELPGRGARFREPFISDMESIVDDLFEQVKRQLQPPYGIYGHSMGAVLGYLLTLRIREKQLAMPCHLFFSGCAGPSVENTEAPKHLLPEDAFVRRLKEFGGCPDEILENDDLLEIFEPIIRADFRLIESYHYTATSPLNIPITVMNGIHERITSTEAMAWQAETTKKVELIEFEGNHFFIFGNEDKILDIISNRVKDIIYY